MSERKVAPFPPKETNIMKANLMCLVLKEFKNHENL